MKNIIIVMLAITLFIALVAPHESANTYPMCGIVDEVNFEEDYIVIKDFNGNGWEWGGIEDWFMGDIVAMIMDDNGTEIIYDDIILDVNYNGFLEDY